MKQKRNTDIYRSCHLVLIRYLSQNKKSCQLVPTKNYRSCQLVPTQNNRSCQLVLIRYFCQKYRSCQLVPIRYHRREKILVFFLVLQGGIMKDKERTCIKDDISLFFRNTCSCFFIYQFIQYDKQRIFTPVFKTFKHFYIICPKNLNSCSND